RRVLRPVLAGGAAGDAGARQGGPAGTTGKQDHPAAPAAGAPAGAAPAGSRGDGHVGAGPTGLNDRTGTEAPSASLPLPLRLVRRFPVLQGIPARVIAIGPLPEHAPAWARRPEMPVATAPATTEPPAVS
ncbi:MAG: hypothetical protein JNM77_17480, partial [Pseudonocardia sp.]|nr:hypothetical protein [Pseudonocardia sp.]